MKTHDSCCHNYNCDAITVSQNNLKLQLIVIAHQYLKPCFCLCEMFCGCELVMGEVRMYSVFWKMLILHIHFGNDMTHC